MFLLYFNFLYLFYLRGAPYRNGTKKREKLSFSFFQFWCPRSSFCFDIFINFIFLLYIQQREANFFNFWKKKNKPENEFSEHLPFFSLKRRHSPLDFNFSYLSLFPENVNPICCLFLLKIISRSYSYKSPFGISKAQNPLQPFVWRSR